MDELTARTAVVTGAASGIGLALVHAFANEGMNVVMADIDEVTLAREADALSRDGHSVHAIGTDVSDPVDVRRLADEASNRFGAVHVLCNNAGVGTAGDPWGGPLTHWEWTIGVNLMGVVHGIRAFLPAMRAQREGHIVNTASMAGLLPHPLLAYTATKYAVVGLSESLAAFECMTASGVDVSVLCPGFVKTNILDSIRAWPERLGPLPPEPDGSGAAKQMIMETMERRGMSAADCAALVLRAIRRREFWILTEPAYNDLMRERAAGIGSGVPTFPPML